ncbi:carboxypeptidase-like regulatory domain-containing protein [Mucilaginibacter litoreus]|uniref:Carboxypeptidase-like regulatory domain-containing protein n=1 Tax=Mucilaginibacter litoreus TaxID=1048221 RepID=A0ABW3AUW1_9SPHI
MEDKRANISQIQQYLAGKLDAKAMHKLERETQDDPFLMDALEGYGNTESAQEANLTALHERLSTRTGTKVKRLTPWALTAIAASVIGFAVVVLLLKNNDVVPAESRVAMTRPATTTAPQPVEKTEQPVLAATGQEQEQQMQSSVQIKSSKKLNNRIAFNQSRQKLTAPRALTEEKEVAGPPVIPEVKSPEVSPLEAAVAEDLMDAKKQDTILGGEHIAVTNNAANVTVLNSKAKGASYKERDRRGDAALMGANLPPGLTGVVLSHTDGLPLPGAIVKVEGRSAATQTDVNGKFTLPNVKKDDKVSVNYLGYTGQTLNVKRSDSIKVELEVDKSALSEVVVAGYSAKRISNKAYPVGGWKAFKRYLDDKAKLTDGKTGTVGLKLTISADGTIADIAVTKSLNTRADNNAIDLIKNGPKWLGNANGQPEKVVVIVKFGNKE